MAAAPLAHPLFAPVLDRGRRPAGRRLTRERRPPSGAAPEGSLEGEATPPEEVRPSEAFLRGQDFVRRSLAGDPATRDEFVVQYGALVRFSIASVLRQRDASLLAEELEDLTQSVLLSFFEADCRRLKMYEGRNRASFATFVRVCATRQTLDWLRSRRRRAALATEDEAGGEEAGKLLERLADPQAGPEARAAVAEGLDRLREAVAELPPREQLLVRLHFVEGLDAPEVALVLGVSENAVHVLKSRVKMKLRSRVRLEVWGDD